MRICFWASDKPRERLLADAFIAGVRTAGDSGFMQPLEAGAGPAACDVAVMVGVKSRELFRAHFSEGIHVVYLDKGYTRHAAASPVKLWEYWRCAIDAHQPSLAWPRPADRLERLGLRLRPFTVGGAQILIAGSSAKYHEFYGLHDPTRWTRKLVKALSVLTERQIWYRPKPSWHEAVPVDGTRFSRPPETIEAALEGAHCLVTHGSNACFEAILAGVPVVALGPAAAYPIAEHSITQVETPRIPSEEERHDWLSRLAYCQFTMPEFADGSAWAVLRPQIFGGPS